MLDHVLWVLDGVKAVIKVTVLLCLKMLLLPVLLGCGIDFATLALFEATVAQRVRFASYHVLCALLLHWVVGISFMLLITVSVLQLREVLHPGVLARIIRPQEMHPDLLMTLLGEPMVRHVKRVVMSMSIYSLLLFFFVWLPVHFATSSWAAAPWLHTPVFPLAPRLLYFFAELQVPVELLVLHMAILACLERFKNSIGDFAYVWLVAMCRWLGLTRYLLPVPSGGPSGDDSEHHQLQPLRPPLLRFVQNDFEREQPEEPPAAAAAAAAAAAVADVGAAPLRRRPWPEDGRDAEVTLAPRTAPALCWLRMAALITCAWMTALVLLTLLLSMPLVFGRGAFALLHVPPAFAHDPFALAVGASSFWIFGKCCSLACSLQLPRGRRLESLRRAFTPQGALRTSGAVALWALGAPCALGALFQVMLVLPLDEQVWALWSVQNWFSGFVFLHLWAAGLACGVLRFIDDERHTWQTHLTAGQAMVRVALCEFGWDQFDSTLLWSR